MASKKLKIVLATLTVLTILLFIQTFIFPVLTYVVGYILVSIEYHLAPVGPLDYSIHNKDNASHQVYIEIAKAESGEIIYKANHTIGPKERIHSKPITNEAGRYRVKVVVDGKIKDERCLCIERLTGGAAIDIERLNGKLIVRISQYTA